MATRFAVATGDWNATSTWSATSGGAPGASVPTLNDEVTLDNFNFVITVSDIRRCLTLDVQDSVSLIIAATGKLQVSNLLTLETNCSITVHGVLVQTFTNGGGLGGSIVVKADGALILADSSFFNYPTADQVQAGVPFGIDGADDFLALQTGTLVAGSGGGGILGG